mmetsp:Transcript_89572/g.256594  ORF Transcript_89572/g.256594 Transcript_89572/m.256594 type:complete len:416 (+) Transcript_89572:1005-2252(+)
MAQVHVLADSEPAIRCQVLTLIVVGPAMALRHPFVVEVPGIVGISLASFLLQTSGLVQSCHVGDESTGRRRRWPGIAAIRHLIPPAAAETKEVADNFRQLLQRAHEDLGPLDQLVEVVQGEAHAALLQAGYAPHMALAKHSGKVVDVQRLQQHTSQQRPEALHLVGAAGLQHVEDLLQRRAAVAGPPAPDTGGRGGGTSTALIEDLPPVGHSLAIGPSQQRIQRCSRQSVDPNLLHDASSSPSIALAEQHCWIRLPQRFSSRKQGRQSRLHNGEVRKHCLTIRQLEDEISQSIFLPVVEGQDIPAQRLAGGPHASGAHDTAPGAFVAQRRPRGRISCSTSTTEKAASAHTIAGNAAAGTTCAGAADPSANAGTRGGRRGRRNCGVSGGWRTDRCGGAQRRMSAHAGRARRGDLAH